MEFRMLCYVIKKLPSQFLKNVRFYSSKPKSCNSEIELRFIQFVRHNETEPRLGAASKNGKSFVELSGGSCIARDMLTFLSQEFTLSELKSKIQDLTPEDPCEICLLPPIINSKKIFCCCPNYSDYCMEQQRELPKLPVITGMYSNAIIGPTEKIIAHSIAKKIDWEVNLAVIMGKTATQIRKENAMDYVFGYTIAQDITARDWQLADNGQFLIGKTMNTFCPIGPAIVHKCEIANPYSLTLATFVNGVQKQCGSTNNMIFKIDEIIEHLTKFVTLIPGDIILTGSPAGIGICRTPKEFLQPGDCLISEIENIGKLINPVISEDEAC